MGTNVDRLAQKLVRLEKLAKAQNLPQLSSSSIENGGISEYDFQGVESSRIGLQHDGTHTAVSLAGPVPPVPSAPVASGGTGGAFAVTWDGTFAGVSVPAALPSDSTFVVPGAVADDDGKTWTSTDVADNGDGTFTADVESTGSNFDTTVIPGAVANDDGKTWTSTAVTISGDGRTWSGAGAGDDNNGDYAETLVTPLDFARVEVHVATVADFTPDVLPSSSTRFGTIEAAGGGKVTIRHDAGTYWVRLVARTQSGKFSDPSDAVQVTVTSPLDHDAVVSIIEQAGTGNQVFYATTPPSRDGASAGDTWRQVQESPGTNIVAEWRWDGSQWVSQQLTGDILTNLDAGKITAGAIQVAVTIASQGSIVAGDPTGANASMTSDGFRTMAVDPDGNQYTSTSLGTQDGADAFELVTEPGAPPVAAISSTGDYSGNSYTSQQDITVGGTPLLGTLLDPAAPTGVLDQFPRGSVAYDFRSLPAMGSTVGQSTTSLVGQFDVTLPAGRRYELRMPWRVNPSKVTGATPTELVFACRAFWSFTTDGSEPPTPSATDAAVLASDDKRTGISRATGVTGVLTATVDAPVATRVKVLIGIYTDVGTQVTPSAYAPTAWVAYLRDDGPATELLAAAPPGSGSAQQYTTTWTASDSRVWDQNGNVLGDAHNVHLGQGWSAGHQYFEHSACVFNGNATSGDEAGVSMQTALTGATVLKVEVGIQSTSWELGSGELQIQKFTGSAISSPDTKAVGTMVKKAYTARSQWQWITDPSMTGWVNSTNRGVYIGPPDWEGPETHAQLASAYYATTSQRPQIRVTYTRTS